MSVSNLEEVKRLYRFPHIAIAPWRDPANSVLAARGGPKSPTISVEDAGRPFIPTYKVTYKLPEKTDDEESEESDDEDDDDQSQDGDDGEEKAQVDSPMELSIPESVEEDRAVAEDYESCQETCQDESNVRDIDASPSAVDPKVGPSESNDDTTAPQNEGGLSVEETETPERLDDSAEAPGKVESTEEPSAIEESQMPDDETTLPQAPSPSRPDDVESPGSLSEAPEGSTEERSDDTQPNEGDPPDQIPDVAAGESGVDVCAPENTSSVSGLEANAPNVTEHAEQVAQDDDHPIDAERSENEPTVAVEPECETLPDIASSDVPQVVESAEKPTEGASECASDGNADNAKIPDAKNSQEEGGSEVECKTEQHDSGGEKKVSFAPGTPEPKPMQRKKKNAKGARSHSKKRVSVPIENLPEDIIAIVDHSLKSNDVPGDAVGDQDVEALGSGLEPLKIDEIISEPPHPSTTNDSAILKPNKKKASRSGKDKTKKKSLKGKPKTPEAPTFGLGIDLPAMSLAVQESDQTDSVVPPVEDTAAVVGETSPENETSPAEEAKGSEPDGSIKDEDGEPADGLATPRETDTSEKSGHESNGTTAAETSIENKSSEESIESDQSAGLDVETNAQGESVPGATDMPEDLLANAKADEQAADNVGEAAGGDSEAGVEDTVQVDQQSNDAPKLPEGTEGEVLNEDKCKDTSDTAVTIAQEEECVGGDEQNEIAADNPSEPVPEEGKIDSNEGDASHGNETALLVAADALQEKTDDAEIAGDADPASRDEKSKLGNEESEGKVEASAVAPAEDVSDQTAECGDNLEPETIVPALDTEDVSKDPIDKPEETTTAPDGKMDGLEDAGQQEDSPTADISADDAQTESLDKTAIGEEPSQPPAESDPVAATEGDCENIKDELPQTPTPSAGDNPGTEAPTVEDMENKNGGNPEEGKGEMENEQLGAEELGAQDPDNTAPPSDAPPTELVPQESDSGPQEPASDKPAESCVAEACEGRAEEPASDESPKESEDASGGTTENQITNADQQCEEQIEEKPMESQEQLVDEAKPELIEENPLPEGSGEAPVTQQRESDPVEEPPVESSNKIDQVAQESSAMVEEATEEPQPAPPPSPTLSKSSSRKPRVDHWERKPTRKHTDEDRRPDNSRSSKRSSRKSVDEPKATDRPHRPRRHSTIEDDTERRRRREARKAEEVARIVEEEKQKAEEEELRRIRREARRAARKSAAEEAARLAKAEGESIARQEAEARSRKRAERLKREERGGEGKRPETDSSSKRPRRERRESVTNAPLLFRTGTAQSWSGSREETSTRSSRAEERSSSKRSSSPTLTKRSDHVPGGKVSGNGGSKSKEAWRSSSNDGSSSRRRRERPESERSKESRREGDRHQEHRRSKRPETEEKPQRSARSFFSSLFRAF